MTTRPPASATNHALALTSLAIFLVMFFFFWPEERPLREQYWLAILLVAGPVLLGDAVIFRTWRNPSTGLDWSLRRAPDAERILHKWFGLGVTFAAIGLLYWLFPVYEAQLYEPFFGVAGPVAQILLLLALPYFALMDRFMKEPTDSYELLGRLVTRRGAPRELGFLRQHALSWLVKAFFLPLMYSFLPGQLESARNLLPQLGVTILGTVFFLHAMIFLVDLLYAVVGYMCTFRITDTHIRTAEPTFFGWAVAVVCYQPFWDFFYQQYIRYHNTNWHQWLGDDVWMLAAWGGAIILCDAVYAWATVCFGARFSNVSYRGTITSGPYRLTRHPAYLFKNISWWLMAVPFVPVLGWEESWRACLALVFNNLIYYWRAKTEERHLMQYPEYREYYEWMEENGVITKRLAAVKRLVFARVL